MGMEYKKIHSCPNDCILYKNEYEDLGTCPMCGLSCYKVKVGQNDDIDEFTKEGPSAKVVWFLPIIPRLKRLFPNTDDAKNLGGMQIIKNAMDYFVIQLILCSGRILIKNFLNLKIIQKLITWIGN